MDKMKFRYFILFFDKWARGHMKLRLFVIVIERTFLLGVRMSRNLVLFEIILRDSFI